MAITLTPAARSAAASAIAVLADAGAGPFLKPIGKVCLALAGLDDLAGTQAAGAGFNLLHRAVNEGANPLNVRTKHTPGAAFGVADIVADHPALATKLTRLTGTAFPIICSKFVFVPSNLKVSGNVCR